MAAADPAADARIDKITVLMMEDRAFDHMLKINPSGDATASVRPTPQPPGDASTGRVPENPSLLQGFGLGCFDRRIS